jgi:hypothetical protein
MGEIDKRLAEKINAEHRAAEDAARSAVEHAMNAGDLLNEAKVSLGYGEWLPWLAANFAGSRQTADVYRKLAGNREQLEGTECQRAGNLSIRGALKELSAPGSPVTEETSSGAEPVSELGGMPRAYYIAREESARLEEQIEHLDLFEKRESGLPVVKDGAALDDLTLLWKLLEAREGLAEAEKSMIANAVGISREKMAERVRERRAEVEGSRRREG